MTAPLQRRIHRSRCPVPRTFRIFSQRPEDALRSAPLRPGDGPGAVSNPSERPHLCNSVEQTTRPNCLSAHPLHSYYSVTRREIARTYPRSCQGGESRDKLPLKCSAASIQLKTFGALGLGMCTPACRSPRRCTLYLTGGFVYRHSLDQDGSPFTGHSARNSAMAGILRADDKAVILVVERAKVLGA